jgi:malonyl-CoA reductase / 3-hydroxypropionate dehydrogenase (NADP+)
MLVPSALAPAAEQFRGQTVYLIGDYLRPHLAGLIRVFLDQCGAARVVLLTERAETAQEMLAALPQQCASGRLRALATNGALEESIEQARARFGDPHLVICTPFHPFLRRVRPAQAEAGAMLDVAEVDELVEQHVTHHARVAQQLALIEGVRLTIVAPSVATRRAGTATSLANAFRAMLRVLTTALSAPHVQRPITVHQIDLVCHADEGEPPSPAEAEAALRNFIAAALAASSTPAARAERRWEANGAAMATV